jgi:hypothetical protein
MAEQPSVGELLFEATLQHFVAEKAKSEANLLNYYVNHAAIGEHPDLVEECVKLVVNIHDANGCIETLAGLRRQAGFEDTPSESPPAKPPF